MHNVVFKLKDEAPFEPTVILTLGLRRISNTQVQVLCEKTDSSFYTIATFDTLYGIRRAYIPNDLGLPQGTTGRLKDYP